MEFSAKIRAATSPIMQGLPPIRLEDKKRHVGAMTVCYHSMVASEPLLKLAASIEGPHQEYFIEHEKEERGHEKWMEKDITALGGSVEGPPPEQIIAMCGEMYYKVRHMGPEHLLGYMAVIEGYPAPPAAIARMKELYPEASHTIAYHAENDVQHYQDLCEQVNQIDPAKQEAVMQSAIRTALLYHHSLWTMYRRVGVE